VSTRRHATPDECAIGIVIHVSAAVRVVIPTRIADGFKT
jgi:hypothetical protein